MELRARDYRNPNYWEFGSNWNIYPKGTGFYFWLRGGDGIAVAIYDKAKAINDEINAKAIIDSKASKFKVGDRVTVRNAEGGYSRYNNYWGTVEGKTTYGYEINIDGERFSRFFFPDELDLVTDGAWGDPKIVAKLRYELAGRDGVACAMKSDTPDPKLSLASIHDALLEFRSGQISVSSFILNVEGLLKEAGYVEV